MYRDLKSSNPMVRIWIQIRHLKLQIIQKNGKFLDYCGFQNKIQLLQSNYSSIQMNHYFLPQKGWSRLIFPDLSKSLGGAIGSTLDRRQGTPTVFSNIVNNPEKFGFYDPGRRKWTSDLDFTDQNTQFKENTRTFLTFIVTIIWINFTISWISYTEFLG